MNTEKQLREIETLLESMDNEEAIKRLRDGDCPASSGSAFCVFESSALLASFDHKGRITDKVRIDFLDWLASRKSVEYKNAITSTRDDLDTDLYASGGRVAIYARGCHVEPKLQISVHGKSWRETIDRAIRENSIQG